MQTLQQRLVSQWLECKANCRPVAAAPGTAINNRGYVDSDPLRILRWCSTNDADRQKIPRLPVWYWICTRDFGLTSQSSCYTCSLFQLARQESSERFLFRPLPIRILTGDTQLGSTCEMMCWLVFIGRASGLTSASRRHGLCRRLGLPAQLRRLHQV